MKRIIVVLAVMGVIGALLYTRWHREPIGPPAPVSVPVPLGEGRPTANVQSSANEIETTELDLATELNDPRKTIRDDLRVLDSVFSVWQTNFLRTGNPVGENAEITAALTGKNSLHVAFISAKNPAINRLGQLCDRWGTPFFFHQLSGTKMEILSAGPDKIRGTADDALLTP